MSWLDVNFNIVRYSPIEGTHYFYDAAYPTAVQFLLNGRWEPWDVGWVVRRAHDPEVKRIAKDAEARLIRDQSSGYVPWPPTSPGSSANGHTAPQTTGTPSSINLGSESPSDLAPQDHPQGQSQPTSPSLICPTSPYFARHTTIPGQSSHTQPHTSPYASRAPSLPLVSHPYSSPSIIQAPPQPDLVPQSEGSHHVINSTEQQLALPPIASIAQEGPPSPLPFAKLRDTKILLSLDGDGIRGLSTALLVESLVNAICSRVGRRLDPYQIFDLIGGVSTNGLLAIMIGRLRMRVHRAREAYANISKTIFTEKLQFFRSMTMPPQRQSDKQVLENSIKDLISNEGQNPEELFFDNRQDSTNVFVISTKVDIGANQPAIIRSYPTRRMAGPELDAPFTTWQAIYASIVAPRYTGPVPEARAVIEPGLLDYGTAKNNPIRDLYYESRKLYSYTNDKMVIISLGAGLGLCHENENNEMARAVEDRAVDANVIKERFEVDHRNLMEQGWMKYFRFNVTGLEDVSLEEGSQMDKVMERTRAYLEMPDVGERFYACVEAVAGILIEGAYGRAMV